MSTALDVGVHDLRSLRRRHARVLGRRTRSAYAALPDTPSRRRVLERTRIPFAVCEDSLLLMGDHAAEFAGPFQTPCLPLLADGHVPTDDAPARQVLAALVDALLPEPVESDETCCVAHSGDADDVAFLERLLRLSGYHPVVLPRGVAAALSQLGDVAFSGIGIDFGAGSTEVAVVHRGVEIARHVAQRGGNWIDGRLASEIPRFKQENGPDHRVDAETLGQWKADRSSILEPTDEEGELLGELYTELLSTTIEEAAGAIAGCGELDGLPSSLHVACVGGVSRVPGFQELLSGVWSRSEFPLSVDRIRLAGDPAYAVARGCLINAELESEYRHRNAA